MNSSGANIHPGADDGQNKECKKIGFRTGKTGNKG